MPPALYILLPVHNRCAVTERFIRCLERQSFSDYVLILIDDGSTDGTAEMVLQHVPAARCLRGNGSWWWAGSLQQGFDFVDREPASEDAVLLIMNDDTEFGPEFLATGMALLASRERSLLMAIAFDRDTLRLRDRGFRVDWRGPRFLHTRPDEENQLLATRGLFLRLRDRREIGDLHPWLLPHYLSDWEFTYRAHRKGFLLLTDPRLRLLVDEKTTGYSLDNSGRRTSLAASLGRLFSIRSKANPIYFSTFVLLACPWRYKFQNVCGAWSWTLRAALRRQA